MTATTLTAKTDRPKPLQCEHQATHPHEAPKEQQSQSDISIHARELLYLYYTEGSFFIQAGLPNEVPANQQTGGSSSHETGLLFPDNGETEGRRGMSTKNV